MAYCKDTDILIGDVTPKTGVMTKHVEQAAEEIDAAIGHLYVVPVTSAAEHTKLLLKNINIKLATGRYFAAMSRGSQEESPNFYAQSLIKEAWEQLKMIVSGQIILGGATTAGGGLAEDDSRAPTLIQADEFSLVAGFYGYLQDPELYGVRPRPIQVWDGER